MKLIDEPTQSADANLVRLHEGEYRCSLCSFTILVSLEIDKTNIRTKEQQERQNGAYFAEHVKQCHAVADRC